MPKKKYIVEYWVKSSSVEKHPREYIKVLRESYTDDIKDIVIIEVDEKAKVVKL